MDIKIPMSSHSLNIKKGRYKCISRKMRLCEFSGQNEIEDGFHFILKRPHYFQNQLKIR